MQESINGQDACRCGHGAVATAAVGDEEPWPEAAAPEPEFCGGSPGAATLPSFYKDLFEMKNERRFNSGLDCGEGFFATGYGVLARSRTLGCPAGSTKSLVGYFAYACERDAVDPLKGLGARGCPMAGNPVAIASGNKYQRELDYAGAGALALRFERHYNSHAGTLPGTLGRQWRHTYDRELRATELTAMHIREDGQVVYFARESVEDTSSPWRALDPDVLERMQDAPPDTLVEGIPVRYLIHTAEDTVEAYDANGRLRAITHLGGFQITLEYDDAGLLARVNDPFGRSLVFSHRRDGQLQQMWDPAQRVYTYTYDAENLLASVEYPSAPGEDERRQYLYDDADHPGGLTHLINERGITYARWDYDAQGRTVLSEHAGGVDRTLLAYHDDGRARRHAVVPR